jgi:predicted transposase/invertase (TIGR01784 family)
MPKFNKTVDQLENRFEKWLYVLRNLNRLDRIPDKLREHIFEKLFEVAEIAKFNPQQILSYEDSLKYYRDMKNSLDTAYEEGREEGELKKQTDIALNAIVMGLDTATISKITGLTTESIEALKKQKG